MSVKHQDLHTSFRLLKIYFHGILVKIGRGTINPKKAVGKLALDLRNGIGTAFSPELARDIVDHITARWGFVADELVQGERDYRYIRSTTLYGLQNDFVSRLAKEAGCGEKEFHNHLFRASGSALSEELPSEITAALQGDITVRALIELHLSHVIAH